MATFTFDGTTSQTVAFNVATDRVIFNLNAEDFDVITEDRGANTVSFTTLSGAVLTLTGTNFAAISAAQPGALVPGVDSDINFDIGTRASNPDLAGNVVVGLEGNDGIVGMVPVAADADGAVGTEAGRPGGVLIGNQGVDNIANGNLFSVRMFGGQDNDRIALGTVNGSDESFIVGGLGADTIAVGGAVTGAGTAAQVTTGGYLGDVTIFGGNQANDPADGADLISVQLGADATATIFGNGGDDVINVTSTTTGSGMAEVTTAGMATVFGGQGDDEINAAVDGGLFVGGLGQDEIDITSVGTSGNSFTVFGGNGVGDAADGRDIITLDLQDNDIAEVYGNGGNDSINIVGSADAQVSVFGGQGNDTIIGSVGDDSLIVGGVGSDVIQLTVNNNDGDMEGGIPSVGSHVTVFGGNGLADAADGADRISVELSGNARGNTAVQSQTAEIYGNGGDDRIILTNGEGVDEDDNAISTGGGAATVFGGQGNDTISVEDGLYTLTGGQGADRFDFSQGNGTLGVSSGSGTDGSMGFGNVDGSLNAGTVAADLSFITDLNFDEDELDLGVNVTQVINTSATATQGATLSQAATNAFNNATNSAQLANNVEAAVIFTYQGEQFLVQAQVQTTAVGDNPAGTQEGDVNALIRVTGFTGTADASDFVTGTSTDLLV